MVDLNEAKEIVKNLLVKIQNRFKQDFQGENEESFERLARQYRAQLVRLFWKSVQKWSKWDDEAPVLMPDNTRLYYRKGNTEILIQEFAPQIRLMKFVGSLAKRSHSTASLPPEVMSEIYHYSLALPYVIFIFKFVKGVYSEVRCMFCDRPLKRLEEVPLRPYLPNIDSNMVVCLGRGFEENERSKLVKNNLTQQVALILNYFWHTAYSDEWSTHFWNNREHFKNSDKRLFTFEDWQETSVENPLFVVEDVEWLKSTDDSFGDIIVRMIEGDDVDFQVTESIQQEVFDDFLKELSKMTKESLETIENKMLQDMIEPLANDILKGIINNG